MQTRIEKDSFGELEIPAEAYYGVHTVRSVRNFGAAGEPVPLEMIYGMAKMKLACARPTTSSACWMTRRPPPSWPPASAC
jgi:aspartate ammonia-lyase